MVLAWHHHPDHETVTIGARRIAEQCGMQRRAVMRALSAMVDSGILTRETETGGRGVYRINTVSEGHRSGNPETQVPERHMCSTDTGGCAPETQGVCPRDTGGVSESNHVEIRDSRDRAETPQPPDGGPSPDGPECVNSVDPWKAAEERFAQHGFRDEWPDPDATRFGFHTESEEPDRSELPTVGERFEAKSEVRASQAADNAGPAPHLTGNERGDSAAVLRWWVSMAPLGQVGGTDMARMKQAIAAQGPALVLKALASMRGRGVHYPQLRAVGQWIRTDRAETIRAERQSADARREATRPVVKPLRTLN